MIVLKFVVVEIVDLEKLCSNDMVVMLELAYSKMHLKMRMVLTGTRSLERLGAPAIRGR